MTEKYSDLEERIKRDRDLSLTGLDRVTYTLRWLDRNPDQVPGRTMTERGCHDLYHAAYYGEKAFRGELEDQGFAFIAGPEPTNAEKLAHYVRQMDLTPMSPNECGKWLDEQGVKAPGGDDD